MSISRTQVVKWAARQIGPGYDHSPAKRDWLFVEHVVRHPELLRHLNPAGANRLVWRFGWMLGWFCFGASSELRDLRILRIVKQAPAFLQYFEPRLNPEGGAVYMFWDIVLSDRDKAHVALREAVFEALSEQLRFSSIGLQHSALHGFGHLKDPRSEPLIREFIDGCPPGELRDYAEMAMRFDVM